MEELKEAIEHLQEKADRYDKLIKTKGIRKAKREQYEKELVKTVADLQDLEDKLVRDTKKVSKRVPPKKKEPKKEEPKKEEPKKEPKKKEPKKKEPKKKEPKAMVPRRKAELSGVYCGARKVRKNAREGTEAECREKGQIRLYGKRQIANREGGKITAELVDQMFKVEPLPMPRPMPVMKKKLRGRALPAYLISKFISASHDKDFHDVAQYKIDRDLSHEWVKVYYNPENKQCVVVHRGSADLADAWTDVKLLFQQKNNERFKTSERVQKAAEAKYGASNVTTIGSSLGGYLAEEFGQNSKEVITVSKPTTPLDVLKGKKKGKHQHDIRTTRDPIAILQNFQKDKKDVIIPSQTFNPAREHMGDEIVQRLPGDLMIGERNEMIGGKLNKLQVRELKDLVIALRSKKRNEFPVTKKKKADLVKMVNQLQQMHGGKIDPNSLSDQLQIKLGGYIVDGVLHLLKYLDEHRRRY